MTISTAMLLFVFALVGSIYSATLPIEERYIGVALPGLSNIIQELKQNLNNSLNVFAGLTTEQRDQLIEELLQGLRDFPNANNIETIKPSQLPQYLSQVHEYAEKMTIALLAKAKNLVESNKSEGTDKREIQHSPAVDTVLTFLRKTFEKALFGITGLTKAQQQELVDEFLRQMKNFPPIKGYVIQYLEDVREFGKNVIDALLAKAKALAASNNQRSTRFALPGLSQLVDEVRQKITEALKNIDGLTSRQRLQLIEELLQSVRNYPNVNGIHTIKPSQFGAYVQQIHDYADEKINYLVAKAHDLAESNKQGKGITRQSRFLPGVDKVVDFLKNNLDKALYRLTGVTKEQHKELVNDFVNQMQKFPVPSWQVIIPGNMEKYIKDVREFGNNLANALLAKAKAFSDLNKNGNAKRAVGELDRQTRFLPGVDKIVDFLKDSLDKALYRLTGVTKEQHKELVNDFVNQMKKFPAPTWQVIVPANMEKYIQDVQEFGKNLVNALLAKAKVFADLNKNGVSKKAVDDSTVEKRQMSIPPFVEDVHHRMVQTIQNLLEEITGLTTEQQEALCEEFKQKLFQLPLPPLTFFDFFNPIKWTRYFHELAAYNIGLTKDIIDKAVKLVKGTLGEDYEVPDVDTIIQKRAEDRGLVLETIKKTFDALINNVPGINDKIKQIIIAEFDAELSNFPPPPKGFNPLAWLTYQSKLVAYQGELTMRLITKAKALLKEQVDKINPDLGKYLQRKDTERGIGVALPGLSSLIDDLRQKLNDTLNEVTGLSNEQRDELVEELLQSLRDFPNANGIETIKPSQFAEHIKKIQDFAESMITALVAKAHAFVQSNNQGKGVSRQARFLPGFERVLLALRDKLDGALFKIGVTSEQHLDLINEFVQQIKNFPSISDFHHFGQSLGKAILTKAIALVDNDKGVSKRMLFGSLETKVSSLYDSLTNKFRTSLQQISGLTKTHVEQLVTEFRAGLAGLPVPPLRQFYNPVKWFQWSTEVASVALELTGTLLGTAAQLAKGIVGSIFGELEEIINEVGKTLNPEVLIANLENLVGTALNQVPGLSADMKQQLISEFKSQLTQLTDLKKLNVLKPKEMAEFLKKIKEFVEKAIKECVSKAEELVKKGEEEIGNAGEGNIETRKIQALEIFDELIQNLYNRLVGECVKGLGTISGLTQAQNDELVEDFKNGLDNFPRPPISQFYNPLRWLTFAGKMTNHALKLTKTILERARDIVKRITNKVITDSNPVEKRQISLPSFVTDMHSRMVQTVRNLLQKVSGLTTEQQEGLAAEFKQRLSEMPMPPLNFFDFFNPIKWTKYLKDLALYNIRLTREIIDKAVKLVKGTLGEDYEVPDVDALIARRAAEDRGVVLETVKKAFDALINNVPGINDEIKNIIIAEFDAELSNFPPPPTSYNPFAWISYQSKLVTYQAELTQRLITKAKGLLKEQVDKINPDLGKYLQRKNTE